MIEERPSWQFAARYTLTDWHGHVRIADGKAIGQWFCVDLESGRRLWEKQFDAPNTICGISEGVIVATETKSGGPWTASFGAWGISVETGELLWALPREVSWWRDLLELVPGVGPPVPGTPLHVSGSRCFCEDGSVLDIRSGEVVGKSERDAEEWRACLPEKGPAWTFYMGRLLELDDGDILFRPSERDEGFHIRRVSMGRPLELDDDDTLFRPWETDKGFHIRRVSPAGQPRWHFDLGNEGHFISGNFYSYRYGGEFIYMVVSDKHRELTLDPARPHGGHFFLWTLDVQTGRLRQRFKIPEATGECRIEDVDGSHVLVGSANQTLLCYRRQDSR